MSKYFQKQANPPRIVWVKKFSSNEISWYLNLAYSIKTSPRWFRKKFKHLMDTTEFSSFTFKIVQEIGSRLSKRYIYIDSKLKNILFLNGKKFDGNKSILIWPWKEKRTHSSDDTIRGLVGWVYRRSRATLWGITDGLGPIPKDNPERCHDNFDPSRRGWLTRFGTYIQWYHLDGTWRTLHSGWVII